MQRKQKGDHEIGGRYHEGGCKREDNGIRNTCGRKAEGGGNEPSRRQTASGLSVEAGVTDCKVQ